VTDDGSALPEAPKGPAFSIPREWTAGVYASTALVVHSPRELTIDFVRIDPHDAQAGVVVARVSLSFDAASDLARDLGEDLRIWASEVVEKREGGDGAKHHRPDSPPERDPDSSA
jgi:Protein of unknown function (DUF3467)